MADVNRPPVPRFDLRFGPDALADLIAGIDGVLETEMTAVVGALSSRVETLTHGSLAEADAAVLMVRAFHSAASGRLVVRRGGAEKVVHFEAGRPVAAASNDDGDRMLQMLARERSLTPAQQEEASRIADATGRRMGALLVDLGLLKPAELLAVVRQHYEEIVLSLFAWTEGRWHFEPGVVVGPDRARLLRHPVALVREGLARSGDEALRHRIGAGANVFVLVPGASGGEVLDELAAAEPEKQLLGLFDGARTMDEVERASGLSTSAVRMTAATMILFGLLRPAAALPPPAGRDHEIARQRVLARHALALEGDYFQFLGLPPDAAPHEVRRALERVGREIALEALGPELALELAEEIATIAEVLGEAQNVLTTPALRTRYEDALRPMT